MTELKMDSSAEDGVRERSTRPPVCGEPASKARQITLTYFRVISGAKVCFQTLVFQIKVFGERTDASHASRPAHRQQRRLRRVRRHVERRQTRQLSRQRWRMSWTTGTTTRLSWRRRTVGDTLVVVVGAVLAIQLQTINQFFSDFVPKIGRKGEQ